MSRILITGASGLLGISCVLAARERSNSVVAVVHKNVFALDGVLVHQQDLIDQESFIPFIKDVRADWVINCAAATDVEWCQSNPEAAYKINSEFPRLLAAACSSNGIKLMHISTDAVFAGTGNAIETDAVSPLNTYAKSKLAGEQYVLDIAASSLIIRTNIYGWNLQPKRSLSEWIVSELTMGHTIQGFTDISFNPILVNHLAGLLLDIMDKNLTGMYHVAGSETSTKYDFAIRIAKLLNLDERLIQATDSTTIPGRTIRPKNSTLNVDKVSKQLGRTLQNIQEGLEMFFSLRKKGYPEMLKSLRN